jgi:hypothetical protein
MPFIPRLSGTLAVVTLIGLGSPAWSQPATNPTTKAILFELRVPAEAVVIIEGEKTQSIGEVRQYQTLPVLTGKKYGYTIKVSFKGKDVTKDIVLKHDDPNKTDLRAEFDTAGAPAKPDEKKPDAKPDDKKPGDDKKPTEKKPDEKKPDEKKPDEKKPDEKKPDEKKPDEKKPSLTVAG